MKPSILVVQENNSECRQLIDLLTGTDLFSSVELTDNGQEALELLDKRNFDILVTDLILPAVDGLTVIKKCTMLERPPRIYILTALNAGKIISEAFSYGAEFCFIKPCEPMRVLNKLKEDFAVRPVSVISNDNNFKFQNRSLDERIASIFIHIGIPAHIKGYSFLRTGIKLAVEDPSIINSITKRLYPSIADIYNTSSSKVERAIRHAIEVAWNKGKIENINSLFGLKVYSTNEKPTNGEFIALIADKLMLDGELSSFNYFKRGDGNDKSSKDNSFGENGRHSRL